jgi:hypothetical protein
VQECGEKCRAVDHCRINDLALARAAPFVQRGQDADGQQHAATTEVSDEIQGREWPFPLASNGFERAGDGDAVDVVSGAHRQRTVLAVTRHAREDQSWVLREQCLGAKAGPLHHAGSEAFDQDVSRADQTADDGHALWCLQIRCNRAASTLEGIARTSRLAPCRACAVDDDDVGTEIRQHHARKGSWGGAGNLQHPDTVHWPGHHDLRGIMPQELPARGPRRRTPGQ